jgi:DNA-binding NtrC family response regulator
MKSVLLFAKKSPQSEALRLDLEASGRHVTMTTSLQQALLALDEPGCEMIIADVLCTTRDAWRELLKIAEERQIKSLLTATSHDPKLAKIMPYLDA